MTFAPLAGYMAVMWIMVMAVAAFLVSFVAPIDRFLFAGNVDRFTISAIQASIAIAAVLALIAGLSVMKKIYIGKKLHQ